MGRMSREKGKRGEREVSNILKEHGYDARRGVQYQGGPDSPDVLGLDGIHIEVKRVESFQLYNALKQSKDDAGEDEYPTVFHRRNNEEWVVVQPLEDWLELYGIAEKLYRQSGKEAECSLRGFLEGLQSSL